MKPFNNQTDKFSQSQYTCLSLSQVLLSVDMSHLAPFELISRIGIGVQIMVHLGGKTKFARILGSRP